MQQKIDRMRVHHVDSISPIPAESNTTNDAKNNEQVDLEREEGEIIEDEFEDIISSDEELSMRKRIEELEARNAELEKIANISGNYNYEISSKKDVNLLNDKNVVATIDLSDIDECPITNNNSNQLLSSSASFSTKQNSSHPQKTITKSTYPKRDTHRGHNQYSRYEISENYNFISSRRNSSNKSRRYSTSPELLSRSVSPVPKTRIKKQRSNNRSSGRSRNRKSKIKIIQNSKKTTTAAYEDLSSSDDNEFYALDRNELRLALKRDINTSVVPNYVSLDKKLFPIPPENDKNNLQTKLDNSNQNTTNETVTNDDAHISSDDSVSLEEQELRLIALKSAVVKKHLERKKRKENEEKKPYSPSDFDNIKITLSPNNYDTIGTGNSMDISPIASPELLLSDNDENTKPIDMDIVNTSDSDEPIFVGQHWMPIQDIPLPNEYNIINPPQLPIIHSPQPRKLLNNEDTLEFINSLIDPMEIEPNHNQYPTQMNLINDEENTKIIISSVSSPEPTDDEELALRTLLLAKMNNSPKIINKNSLMLRNQIEINTEIDNSTIHSKQQIIENVDRNEFNLVEHEVDALRNLILNTMKPHNKTATVLKEAVRRLKNSSNETNYSNNSNFNEYSESYQEPFTNLFPEHMNYNNIPQMINSAPYLVNNENLVYDNSNIQLNQSQLLPSYFQENNYQLMPNFTSPNLSMQNTPNNRDLNRPALKVVPIKELTECRDKSINNTKNTQANDNLIEVPLKDAPTIRHSPNLKEIPLTNHVIRNENEILPDSNENISEISDSPKEADIVEKLNSPKQIDNVENSIQTEQSLEISKRIASLKQLSNSIEQTTELSKKSKIPLARKSAPGLTPKSSILPVITKKIVNANKVINQQSVNTTSTSKDMKRKVINQQQNDDVIKKSRIILSQNTSTNKINNNLSKPRLVTNLEVPKVNKMIISLGNSSATDSEDEFYEMGNISIENKYFDNASPMSVQMDSPYYSPNPSTYNSPCPSVVPNEKQQTAIEEIGEEGSCGNDDGKEEKRLEKLNGNQSNEVIVGKSVVNDVFQAKLDQFLKNARTQVESIKKIVESPVAAKTPIEIQNPVTPLAVRHLPESSQMEYRRLVNRMKTLEKQKQTKNSNNLSLPNFQVTITNDKASAIVTNQGTSQLSLLGIKKTITNDVSKLSDDSLIRKVLIKNTTTNSVTNPKESNESSISTLAVDDANDTQTTSTLNSKPKLSIDDINAQKFDLLHRYEAAYLKNGSNVLENIEKALILVNEGKKAKCKKLLLQERLAELNKEMEQCKKNLKIHADEISKIYPDIINIHKVIGNCKTRRIKLHKVTSNLGKNVKGDTYSLEDCKKHEIDEKFRNLSVEIKTLKNLNINDIKNKNDFNILNDKKPIIEKDVENVEKAIENNNSKDNDGNAIDNNNITKNEIEKVENNSENIQNIENSTENNPEFENNNEITQNIENHPEQNEEIENNNEITQNIENTAENNANTESNNEYCAITLKDVDTSKLVYQIENINDNAEKNDTLVEPEIEKTMECSETVPENITPERNISPPMLSTNLNQVDEPNNGYHYTSPLDYKNEERQLRNNPNDIICPYELMGQCDDKDCKYGHLSNIGKNKSNDDTNNGADS